MALVADRYWYQLDGTWHASVAVRSSSLHLARAGRKRPDISLCARQYFLYDEGAYTEKEAADSGRQCKQCLKLGAIDSRHSGTGYVQESK